MTFDEFKKHAESFVKYFYDVEDEKLRYLESFRDVLSSGGIGRPATDIGKRIFSTTFLCETIQLMYAKSLDRPSKVCERIKKQKFRKAIGEYLV